MVFYIVKTILGCIINQLMLQCFLFSTFVCVQDLGNINCTFFTHRDSYDRKHNLQMVVDGLAEEWPHLDIHVNSRDDLMLNQFYKV